MGKPFARELELLPSTVVWAKGLDLEKLNEIIKKYNHPVYIVGSGGSFSACLFAADLLGSKGIFAKAITPLELFYSRATIRKSNIIFVSASGRNTDILFAFKKAVESEPVSIITICMQKNTKLTDLAANYSACNSFEFEPPSGKDGFLATNSLAAYFVIFYRAITGQAVIQTPEQETYTISSDFLRKISSNTCFTVLYGSYNHAVAVDLESKFTEAGLAPSLISDFRHFAHGRHNWFDKKKDSAIIALTSPADELLCHKTLDLLPGTIPKVILKTDLEDFEGTIQLLLQSMELINLYSKKQGIDPGRPGVPDYGSKIYHLKYERLIAKQPLRVPDIAILRKTKINNITDLSPTESTEWQQHYKNFIKKLTNAKFGSLILDYDGTLCSPANRFSGMGEEVKSYILDFVKNGFILAVISGRGKSLREDLEKVFQNEPEFMQNVIVGYYNGSDIAPLSDKNHPIKNKEMNSSLSIVKDRLIDLGIKPEESPNQLTIGTKSTQEWSTLKEILLNEIMLLDISDVTMVESSHSIDIIPRKVASKNNILHYCSELCKSLGLLDVALCIGDKGQWPGNDYALLANDYSLSVGEVSSNPETGWNICPPSIRDEKALTYLFGKITFRKSYFRISGL